MESSFRFKNIFTFQFLFINSWVLYSEWIPFHFIEMIKHLGIQSTRTAAYQRLSRVQIQSISTSLLCGSSQEAAFQASPQQAGSGRLHKALSQPAAPLRSHHFPWSTSRGPPPHTSLRPQRITQTKSPTAHLLPPRRCSDIYRNPGVCNSADRGHVGPRQDRRRLWQKMQKLGSDWTHMWAQFYFLPSGFCAGWNVFNCELFWNKMQGSRICCYI